MTAPSALPGSLFLVGGGKMGRAMLEGWLALGMAGGAVTVLDPDPSAELSDLVHRHGVTLDPDLARLAPPEVLVLAIKPQVLAEAAPTLAPLAASGTLLISVLAGTTVAGLQAACPNVTAIVRAMPNLPASIGRGATGAYAAPGVTEHQHVCAATLLACNGLVEWVDSEDAIDAVTAVSGSGPAYVFLLAECLAEAGIAAGLDGATATRLARATVAGAGALLDASPLPAAQLRRDVTSPGGTTAAALDVLMAEPGGLAPLMKEAVAAAKRRAAELAG